MPHGRHICTKAYDMVKEIICEYPQSYHSLPHWKCVLRYCEKSSSINIPDQEIDGQYFNTIPSICFHIYHIIARYTTNDRLPLTDRKTFCKCKQDNAS